MVRRLQRLLIARELLLEQERKGDGRLISTGSFISLVLLGRRVEGQRNSSGGVARVKGRGHGPSASWDENTIMTECPQESGHPHSACGRNPTTLEGLAPVYESSVQALKT
jgi:hypothetical protein